MKATLVGIIVTLATLGGFTTALAVDLKEKVKVEIESVGLHPGMDPGMYVCAGGHLHIRGKVQNLADVSLGRIKVAGKAFNADGKLLGTAASSTKEPLLGPGEKARVDLEFLTVTGPLIRQAKRTEVTVIEARPKQ